MSSIGLHVGTANMSDEPTKTSGTTETAAAIQKLHDVQDAKLRGVWKALEAEIVKSAPEGHQFEVLECTAHGRTVFCAKLDGQDVYPWTLSVIRDRTSHTTAVRGFHTHTNKNTHAILVGGGAALPPNKRFPEKKDGTHSYAAAAAYFWEAVELERAAARKKATHAARRQANAALLAEVPDHLRHDTHLNITPSVLTDNRLTVQIRTQYEMTPKQVVRLAALLKTLGEELAQDV